MGMFHYGSEFEVEFRDRDLVHLQIVIGAKLRRDESFYFSWRDTNSIGSGRTTAWINPANSLRFVYHGSVMPEINEHWLRELDESADSAAGLILTSEPPQPAPAVEQHSHERAQPQRPRASRVQRVSGTYT
jgi:hypothetical protein